MGAITSLFVRKVVAAAGAGVDQAALLRSIGLDPRAEANVADVVSDQAYYDLLERVAASLDDATELPLRVGASMRCDDYGAFGLAWKTAPTLRASLSRAERYARLLTSVAAYEVRRAAGGAFFVLHRAGERRLGLRLSNEATLASVASIIREVSTAPFTPLEVHLKHAPPRATAAHAAYFGCPVVFEADFDALLISSEALARPNRLGDEGVTRFLTDHLDRELEKLRAAPSLEELVRDAIAGALSDGVPKMATVARRLGMSERTLQRRLGEEGLSFQKLAAEARRALAARLLSESGYSLAEVAFLTGFSEQSAFNRAFKRWTNRTPASFRQAAR